MSAAQKERPLIAVTGSQQPYIFDLPHLLSLPAGFEFRFRYRPKWVAPELLARIRSDPEAFSERTLIIVFHSQQTKRLLPVRRATVISIEQLGPMIFLRFRVGPFVNAAMDGTSLRTDIASCVQPEILHQRAAVLLEGEVAKDSRDFAEALGDGMYLRQACESSEIPWTVADGPSVTIAWASLIEILQTEPVLEGVPMFYLLGFQDRAGRSVPPVAIGSFWDRKRRVQAFRLVERRRYSLRLFEWAEPPKALPQVRVECEYNPTILDLEGASNLVVGRYDALEFAFFARAPGYMELAVRAEPIHAERDKVVDRLSPMAGGVAEKFSWIDWPRILAIRVPVKVAQNGWRVSVTLLAVGAGLLAYLFSETFAKCVVAIAPRLAGSPLKEGIQVAGLYVLFLALGEYVERFVKARDAVLKVGQPSGDQSGTVSV